MTTQTKADAARAKIQAIIQKRTDTQLIEAIRENEKQMFSGNRSPERSLVNAMLCDEFERRNGSEALDLLFDELDASYHH